LWERLFAADPSIVGRTVRVDGEPYQVVGIAPPDFSIPDGVQIWSPLAYTSEQWNNRRNRNLVAIARLADGASIHEARAEIGSIAERLQREYPETNASVPNGVVTFTRGMSDPGAGAFLTTMVAASVLLLLIACANIANLLLARGSERAQEFAVRLALGASRRRLACQLMIEGGLLSSFAVLLALPLAAIGLSLSRASIPPSIIRFIPGWQYMQVSPAVFAATAAFAATATLVFALVPALQTIRPDVADTLRQSSRSTTAPRRRHWLRTTLASAQVALTLALLFGSGLLLTAADGAINGTLGYDKQNLLVARLVLPERPYADTERRRQFINGVLDRIRQIPAVSSASMISNLPYAGGNTSREFYPDSAPVEPRDVRTVHYRRVATGYFDTMRIPLLAGRTLTDADREDAQQVAVVSRRLADRYWPNGDAVGRQFRVARDGDPITVVGVVGDILHDWFQQQRYPTVYRPLGQEAPFAHAFVVRTIGDPTGVAGDLRRAVRAMDPDQPVIAVRSMEKHVEERAAGLSFIARALGVVAFIALVVAIMGLYSLMAFIVSRRTQELGVRMALGATQWQVIGVTSRQGLRITFAGLFIGSIAAAAVGRLMEAVLLGIVSPSAWQLATLIAVVAGISALACYIPARRTANLDPTIALRAE
jgi:putative ABC transport system permease protein